MWYVRMVDVMRIGASRFHSTSPIRQREDLSGATLNCGLHQCPSKCHQLSNHSKMSCEHISYSKCSNSHSQQWKCHKGPPAVCSRCEKDIKDAEKKRQADFLVQEKRDAEQRLHDQRLAELDAKLASERIALRDAQLAQEREYAIRQKEYDIKTASALRASQISNAGTEPFTKPNSPDPDPSQRSDPTESSTSNSPAPESTVPARSKPSVNKRTVPTANKPLPLPPVDSPSQTEWKRQKRMEGASNDAIDSIMEMTGLEAVKAQVLKIKAKIDTTKRQNTSLKDERFNILLLGNPGTGTAFVSKNIRNFF